MVVQYFDSVDHESTEDLPWVKDYIRSGNDGSKARDVLSCYVGDKGILVLTAKWKGFVRKGTTTYQHLIQALNEYPKVKTGTYALVASGLTDGKCRVGIDKDTDMMYWIQEGKAYHQKSNGGDGGDVQERTENPLLVFPVHPPEPTNSRTGAKAKGKATE